VDFGEPTLLGVAAIIASITGLVTTILGVRRARKEERDRSEESCRDRLRVARLEAEEAAAKLHELRMQILDEH